MRSLLDSDNNEWKATAAAEAGGNSALPSAAAGLALAAAAGAAYAYSLAGLAQAETALLKEKLAAQAAAADELRVELGGKTNSAFVFVKPHACKETPGKVGRSLRSPSGKPASASSTRGR